VWEIAIFRFPLPEPDQTIHEPFIAQWRPLLLRKKMATHAESVTLILTMLSGEFTASPGENENGLRKIQGIPSVWEP
jgi:hypothetical protein